MPVVVDGYVVYDGIFAIIQRCWAHILLKAEEVYIRCKDRSFQQVYRDLYHRLCNIHRKAKKIAADTAHLGGADAQTCQDLQTEVECVMAAYGDIKYATHLRNALPHLFTFLLYPGMPSTNNGTERDIRDAVVMQRRFRHKFFSPEGMRVFSILMSFSKTCQKMNLVPSEMLECIIESPDFDVVSYGLSGLNPRALPAPSPDVAGVDCTHMDNTHDDAPQSHSQEHQEENKQEENNSDAPQSHSQEQTATPSYDDPPKPDITANPTALLYNVLVAILVTVWVVCDQPDSPAGPTTQATPTTHAVAPLLSVESPRQHGVSDMWDITGCSANKTAHCEMC